MATIAPIAEIAALTGDPTRAAIVQALMDGRALTATELARAAGITPQTASGHLTQLIDAGLLEREHQGRHRYHRLASPMVASLLESLMPFAADATFKRQATGPRDRDMRMARTCYDHIAGQLGVRMTDAMVARGLIERVGDIGTVTDPGVRFFTSLGIAFSPQTSRPVCKPCLDWSERRPHLAGQLGAALCQHCLTQGWVRRRSGNRTLDVTPLGDRAFRDVFGFARLAGV